MPIHSSTPAHSGRPLLLSNAIDAAGRQIADLAIDIIAVALLGATAAQMGLLNALGTAAFLILGIPIGVYVDRRPTVRVIARSGLVRSGLLATVVLAWHLDVLTLWHLYLVAAMAGTATVVTETAQTAITPRIAGVEGTSRLVASMQSAEALIGLVIPAGAGLVVAALGAPPVLALGVVVITLAALVITRQRIDPAVSPAAEPRPGLFREARVGWTILRGERILWRLTVAGLLINLGLAMYSALEAVLVVRTLGLGSAGLGAIVSAGALGGLAGAAAAVPAATRFGESRVLIGAGAGLPLAAGQTFIAILRPAEALGWLVAGAFTWGLAIVMYNVHSSAVTARLTPPEAMGRVWAARRTITMGVVPAGSVLGGLLADQGGMTLAVGTWIAVTALGTAGIVNAMTLYPERRAPRSGAPRG